MTGFLEKGETHPSTQSAFIYAKARLLENPILLEAMASVALSGNRPAEICSETARRILSGEPVSDRYILGLAWNLMEMETG